MHHWTRFGLVTAGLFSAMALLLSWETAYAQGAAGGKEAQPPPAAAGEQPKPAPAAEGAADTKAADGADKTADQAQPPAPSGEAEGEDEGSEGDDDDDSDWGALDDSPAARNARIPMVIPDMSKQPLPPGADWEPPPTHSWVWYNLTAARVNPLGLSTQLETGYRLQLWRLPGALYEQSFFAIKGKAQITPAFTKLGGKVEFQPLAILNLSAAYDYMRAFGSFNSIQSFTSFDEEHDDETLDEYDELPADPRSSRAVSGQQLTLGMLLQAKVWNIAVRNRTNGIMMNLDLPDNRIGFWDVTTDIMFPNNGWVVTNDLDLLYLTDFGLRLGGRYTYTHAYYDDEVEGAANTPTHRVGPAAIYTFFDEPGPAAYDKPTLALLLQWWAKHRYRTGAVSNGGIPYILLAFIQQGDLITSK